MPKQRNCGERDKASAMIAWHSFPRIGILSSGKPCPAMENLVCFFSFSSSQFSNNFRCCSVSSNGKDALRHQIFGRGSSPVEYGKQHQVRTQQRTLYKEGTQSLVPGYWYSLTCIVFPLPLLFPCHTHLSSSHIRYSETSCSISPYYFVHTPLINDILFLYVFLGGRIYTTPLEETNDTSEKNSWPYNKTVRR